MRFPTLFAAALTLTASNVLAQDPTTTAPAPAPATPPAPTQRPVPETVQIPFMPEARLDLIAGDNSALQAGLSVTTALSTYFSLGATAGAGISESGFSGRGDLFGRFSLDPYHQNAWEPYVGGGATVRLDTGGPGTHAYVLGFVGLAGPTMGNVAPGLELGVGGGVRLGVTLRWGSLRRR